MRTPLIAGNWKMNTNVKEALSLARTMIAPATMLQGVDILVCPPAISIYALSTALRGTPIKLGAQNMHYESKGAYTGEISPAMLAGLCEYVIIGHSERRMYFHEDDALVNKKTAAALAVGLKPIVAVGERLVEREAGKTEEVITRQITKSLAAIPASPSLVIAYEPVWAIGTGRAASPEDAAATVGLIRRLVTALYHDSFAQQLRILYGGSVTAQNISELMAKPEIDGGLIGGASLRAEEFMTIAQKAAEARRK